MTTTTNTDRATMIRPGLMLAFTTKCTGGVSYQRVDLDAEAAGIIDAPYDNDGTPGKVCTVCNSAWPAGEGEAHADGCVVGQREVTRWETTRVIDDPTERHAAEKARGIARRSIMKHCARTAFGLLCPEALEEELNRGIAEARAAAQTFNATSIHTKVHVYVMKGRVASDDREAAKAIAQEVRELLEEMNAGISALDVEAIRKAASKAKEVGSMLAPEQAEMVSEAVAQARRAARQISTRIGEKAEDAKVVLADMQRGSIERARMAFLDFDTPSVAPAGEALPPVNVQRMAALDLGEQQAVAGAKAEVA